MAASVNDTVASEKCRVCRNYDGQYTCPHCEVKTCSLLCENTHREEECVTLTKKLEICEICNRNKAKYTCPKCEVRSCSLECVNVHKKELPCDGIRDKTKYIPLHKFNDLDLLNDYRLLEEVGRSVDKFQRDPMKWCTTQGRLPIELYRLKSAAFQKGMFLHLMSHNFSKRKENNTYLDSKTNEILWRVEWIFPQAKNAKWITEKTKESQVLSDLLEPVLNPLEFATGNEKAEIFNKKQLLQDKLQFYRSVGLPNLKVLLKAEKVTNRDSRFYELDLGSSLLENFQKKHIIEYPSLYVIFRDHSSMFEIIDSDDEGIAKTEKNEEGNHQHLNRHKRCPKRKWKNPSMKPSEAKVKNEKVNYFFDQSMSDSDDENPKRSKNESKLCIPEYNELVKMDH